MKRLLLIILFSLWALSAQAAGGPDRTRVAILPLDTPANQPDLKQYGTGTMDTLIQTLSTLPNFVMVDRARIENIIKEQQFGQTGMVDPKSAVTVGKLVGAQILVTGNLLKAGDKVRITAHFTDMKTGQITKSEVVTGTIDQIFDLMDQLAQKFIAAQGVQVSQQEQQRMEKVVKSTANLSAYDYYLKGRQAFMLFTAPGYTEAIQWFSKAIETDPKYALAYAGLGDAYTYLGWSKRGTQESNQEDYRQALSFSKKALELNPDLPDAHRALGSASGVLAAGGYEREIRKALELNPNDAQAWYELWYATGNQDEPDQEFIVKALDLNPDLAIARSDRGAAYRVKEKYKEAVAEYRRSLKISPNNAEALNGLGEVLFDMEKYKEALAEYQEAARVSPNSAAAHNGIAWCLYQLKAYEKALPEFQEALRINPGTKDASVFFGMGDVLWELGRWAECVHAYEETLRINPKHKGALEWLPQARAKLQGGE